MVATLTDILNIELDDLHKISIPYVHDGFARLIPILYTSRFYLKAYSNDHIEHALTDLLELYHWYYQQQSQAFKQSLQAELDNMPDHLKKYINVDQCVAEQVESLKLSFISDLDVLFSILHEFPDIAELRDIDGVTSDMNNCEYFSVFGLYKAAKAITALRHYQNEMKKPNTIENSNDLLAKNLAQAIQHYADAQLATETARQLDIAVQNSTSNSYQQWLQLARQDLSQTGLTARHGDNYILRKAKAIEIYQANQHKSRRQAALDMIPALNQFLKENNIQPLKPGSEYESIYKWLSQYDKENN